MGWKQILFVNNLFSFIFKIFGILLSVAIVYLCVRSFDCLYAFTLNTVLKGLFDYFGTIQSGSVQFAQNFFILFGWIIIFYSIWFKSSYLYLNNLYLLGGLPLAYNFVKNLVSLYVEYGSLFTLANLSLLFSSLEPWLLLVKNEKVLLMFTQNFAVGDLTTGLIIFVHFHHQTNFSWVTTIKAKLFITAIIFISFMLCPLGLTLYLLFLFLLSIKNKLLFNSLISSSVLLVIIAIILNNTNKEFILFTWLNQLFSLSSWSPSSLFSFLYLKGSILFSWFVLLICLLNKRMVKFAPLLLFSIICPLFVYNNILIQYQLLSSSAPKPDFFSINGWMSLLSDELVLIASLAHVSIINLGSAVLILLHFYAEYEDIIVNKLLLVPVFIINSFLAPLALVLYALLSWSLLKLKKKERTAEEEEMLDSRPVHWGENLPAFPQLLFYIAKAVVGTLCLLLCVLLYLLFAVWCYIYYTLFGTWASTKGNNNPTFKQFPGPSPFIPSFIRNVSGQMRVYLNSVPLESRGTIWNIRFFILQLAAIVEIAPNANVPNPLSASLAEQFGGVFPFGDGIGIGDRDKVMQYLNDQKCRKGPRSLAGTVSSTQALFCYWSTITLGLYPEDQGKKVKDARSVLFAWINNFDSDVKTMSNDASFKAMASKWPRLVKGQVPNEQELFGVFGDVLYWMATKKTNSPGAHGQMSRNERNAFLELVNNLFQFFPDWFNFCLLGGYMERNVNSALYTMREAMFRDKGIAYEAAMNRANEVGLAKSEALRLIVSVFAIAGAAVPCKILVAILKRIQTDPVPMIALYQKNKVAFIKECARLDPAVFWVNLISHEKEVINNIEIAEGTPVHLYIPFANLDPRVFGPNALEFDPSRSTLDQIMTWNGLESVFDHPPPSNSTTRNNTRSNPQVTPGTWNDSSYPRRCPGHDVAINALQVIVDHYVPLIQVSLNKPNNMFAPISLNLTTNIITSATTKRAQSWSERNDYSFNHFTKRNLAIRNFPPFALPTFDEDFSDKVSMVTTLDFGASVIPYILASDQTWISPDADIQVWRELTLPSFPLTVHNYDPSLSQHDLNNNTNSLSTTVVNGADTNTDEVISRLAFFGLGCHRTSLIKNKSNPGVKYANDTMALGDFDVRPGFAKYGALVYFDDRFRPVRIILRHNNIDISKPVDNNRTNQSLWEFAKWAWKVSIFTWVTLRDHLLECHLIKAAALAKCSREVLSTDNLLRKVLKPFTYHTIYINELAGRTLYCNNGLADRVWAFKDINTVLTKLKDTYVYDEQFVQLIDPSLSEAEFPLRYDYDNLLKIITRYIKETVSSLNKKELSEAETLYYSLLKEPGLRGGSLSTVPYSTNSFIRLVSHLIINGSGIHEQVGQISDYQVLPNITGAKILDDLLTLREPTQSYALNTALTSGTGIIQPMLMDDWSYLFKNKTTLSHYLTFKQQLSELSVHIRSRRSRYPYHLFDPSVLNTSVSK